MDAVLSDASAFSINKTFYSFWAMGNKDTDFIHKKVVMDGTINCLEFLNLKFNCGARSEDPPVLCVL